MSVIERPFIPHIVDVYYIGSFCSFFSAEIQHCMYICVWRGGEFEG